MTDPKQTTAPTLAEQLAMFVTALAGIGLMMLYALNSRTVEFITALAVVTYLQARLFLGRGIWR